ncbi:MAG: endonuclease domain-containing protein [Pseudomonadota bacterium]|nr:endonuclease domain-containing protein [Pseudomonadota bacterium]
MTLPEILLRQALRQRPGGHRFRKQHPAGELVLDFFCAEAKLCIEVDGEVHDRGDQPAFDVERDAWLRLHGIDTLRITAADVQTNLGGVIVHIVEAACARSPLPETSSGRN